MNRNHRTLRHMWGVSDCDAMRPDRSCARLAPERYRSRAARPPPCLAVVGLLVAISLAPNAAHADDRDLIPETHDQWIVTVGSQFQVGPMFPGSRKFGVGAEPLFSVRRDGSPEVFTAPDDSLDFTLLGNRQFR